MTEFKFLLHIFFNNCHHRDLNPVPPPLRLPALTTRPCRRDRVQDESLGVFAENVRVAHHTKRFRIGICCFDLNSCKFKFIFLSLFGIIQSTGCHDDGFTWITGVPALEFSGISAVYLSRSKTGALSFSSLMCTVTSAVVARPACCTSLATTLKRIWRVFSKLMCVGFLTRITSWPCSPPPEVKFRTLRYRRSVTAWRFRPGPFRLKTKIINFVYELCEVLTFCLVRRKFKNNFLFIQKVFWTNLVMIGDLRQLSITEVEGGSDRCVLGQVSHVALLVEFRRIVGLILDDDGNVDSCGCVVLTGPGADFLGH